MCVLLNGFDALLPCTCSWALGQNRRRRMGVVCRDWSASKTAEDLKGSGTNLLLVPKKIVCSVMIMYVVGRHWLNDRYDNFKDVVFPFSFKNKQKIWVEEMIWWIEFRREGRDAPDSETSACTARLSSEITIGTWHLLVWACDLHKVAVRSDQPDYILNIVFLLTRELGLFLNIRRVVSFLLQPHFWQLAVNPHPHCRGTLQ